MRRLAATCAGLIWLAGAALAGPLYDAARQGDTATIKAMLGSGTSVDARGPNLETPLMAAALTGNLDTAIALLDAGADVMARNRSGFTPLHAAAYGGAVDTARLLLERGADIDASANRAGKTPIYMAADENHIEVVRLLLENGADVANIDKSGFTVLIRAMFRYRYDIVGLLKQHGATCPPPEAFGPEFHQLCSDAGE